jgi:ABC-2 type transport system ATP-binding protein
MERERVFRLVAQQDKLVIFSTHIPRDAESIAQTVIVLHEGRVLFCGAPEELRASATGLVYQFDIAVEAFPQVATSMLVSHVKLDSSHARLRVIGKPAHFEATTVSPSLEDAYLLLTKQHAKI